MGAFPSISAFRHWLHVNVQFRNGTPLECEEVSDMRDQKLDGGGESFLTPAAGKRWQFPTSSQGGGSKADLRKFRSEEPSVRHQLHPFRHHVMQVQFCSARNCIFVKFEFQ